MRDININNNMLYELWSMKFTTLSFFGEDYLYVYSMVSDLRMSSSEDSDGEVMAGEEEREDGSDQAGQTYS